MLFCLQSAFGDLFSLFPILSTSIACIVRAGEFEDEENKLIYEAFSQTAFEAAAVSF